MLIYDMPHTLHAGMSSDKFVNEPTGSRGLKWCIHSGNKNDKMFNIICQADNQTNLQTTFMLFVLVFLASNLGHVV